MTKSDVVALLDMMYGDEYILQLRPVFLERYQYNKKPYRTKKAGRWYMWEASIDCSDVYTHGSFWHPTNHKAAEEIYKIVLKARSENANR